MRKVITILLNLFLITGSANSQKFNVDSTLPRIAAEKNDSIRARLIWYTLGTSETDPVLEMEISERLLLQSETNKNKMEEIFALAFLGYDYRALGDNTKSLRYNLKAVALAEQVTNQESKAMAKMCLAFNYQDLADYSKAINLNLSAIDCASKANFHEVLTICLISLGEIYLNLNKIDSSLMYSQRAYELSLKAGYTDFSSAILRLLGNIQAKLGNPSLAENYFSMAVKEGYNIKSPKYISIAYNAKAQYYNNKNEKDSSLLYAKKAIEVVQHTAFSTMSIYPAKLLLDIYRNSNVDSAFKYSEMYRLANDSLFNTKTIQEAQLMTFEEEARQQQQAIDEINSQHERMLNIEYALIALGIVTFIVLFSLLSRRIITNTKLIEFIGVIALLIVFEFLNLLLHPFLEKITHHSPLLMLLALVAIATLLIPIHHKAEKWATSRLVEKNKLIRLAAAKKTIEQLDQI
jgi:tetratricopeptide (TPR) repeat protein